MKLLVFTAIWCRPCQQVKTYLNVLDGVVPYQIIDIDEDHESLAIKYNVRGVPTMILVDDYDKEIKRQVGSMSESKLLEWVQNAQI